MDLHASLGLRSSGIIFIYSVVTVFSGNDFVRFFNIVHEVRVPSETVESDIVGFSGKILVCHLGDKKDPSTVYSHFLEILFNFPGTSPK